MIQTAHIGVGISGQEGMQVSERINQEGYIRWRVFGYPLQVRLTPAPAPALHPRCVALGGWLKPAARSVVRMKQAFGDGRTIMMAMAGLGSVEAGSSRVVCFTGLNRSSLTNALSLR